MSKKALDETHLELRSLISSTMLIVEFSAKAKGLELKTEVQSDVSDFYLGDPFHIQQILLGLLNSAIKIFEKGSVFLRISKVGDLNEDATLLFEVTDHLNSLGSRFFFQIALKRSNAAHLKISERSLPRHQLMENLSAHVLIAGDNQVSQQVISRMVKDLGCSYSLVENGLEVLAALQAESFHLILMDGQLPLMDGYEATRKIRNGEAGPENQRIPIIAVTANATQDQAQTCFEAGMDELTSKPIALDDFSSKVKKWISRGHGAIERRALENLRIISGQGKKDLVKELILLFKRETPQAIKNLRDQIKEEDFLAASKTAHFLKSSCANLGAFRMQDLAEKIEKAKSDNLLGLVDSLEKEYDWAAIELQKYIVL